MKVLWIFNHPAPYKVAFLKELGPQVGEVVAVYERRGESDRNDKWYENREACCPGYRPVYLQARPIGNYNVYSRELPKIVAFEKPDVIVVNGYSTLAEMHLISYLKRKKIPYVFAINGGIVKKQESWFKRKLKEHYIKGASLYLSPDGHSSSYLTHYGADPSKIRTYPYATIREENIPERPLPHDQKMAYWAEDPLVKAAMPGTKRVYAAIGSYIERKNGQQLLSYWTKVPSDYLLLMIGEGGQKEQYLSFIEKNGLKNVILYPFLNHEGILKALRHADGSIFLTKEDIYGHVVNESLSQGTPVIGSIHSNAALKLLADDRAGWLVDPSSEDAFLAAINAPLSEEKAEAAIKVAHLNTVETMVAAHLKLLSEFQKGSSK